MQPEQSPPSNVSVPTTSGYTLPYTIRVSPLAAATTIGGYIVAVAALWIVFLIWANVYVKATLGVGLIIGLGYFWGRQLRLRLILTDSTIEYRQVSSTVQIAYKDIQKIGYHVTAGGGRYGARARRWMDFFVAGQSKPIRVPISIFRTKDIFALLQVVLQKSPAVLLGDTIAQSLNLGFIPSKLPPVTFGRFEKQDKNFVPAPSPSSSALYTVNEELRPRHLMLGFAQLVLVLLFLYFFSQLAFGPLAICLGALFVVQLIGLAFRPPRGP